MRTFETFPKQSVCPICKTNEDKPCTLASIDGTAEGNICQGQPVHVDCIMDSKFKYNKGIGIVYTEVKL